MDKNEQVGALLARVPTGKLHVDGLEFLVNAALTATPIYGTAVSGTVTQKAAPIGAAH